MLNKKKLTHWKTTDSRSMEIEDTHINETINQITYDFGTTVNYVTTFYDDHVKLKQIKLPMISNHSLDHIKTKKHLLEILSDF